MNNRQAGQSEGFRGEQGFFDQSDMVNMENPRIDQVDNQKQGSGNEVYQNRGSQVIEAGLNGETITSSGEEWLSSEVQGKVNSASSDKGQLSSEEKNNIIETRKTISKGALLLIKKKNAEFENDKISPEEYYNDTRGLMQENVNNSYGRKIAA